MPFISMTFYIYLGHIWTLQFQWMTIFFHFSATNWCDYIVVIYQSPSQSAAEFDKFLSRFEQLLNHIKNFNPFLTTILGDFNARPKS